MSSAFQDQFAAVAHELHQQWLGEEIVHWPGGDASQQTTVTAEWEPDPAAESLTGGRHLQQRGKLRIDAGITIHRDDQFVIRGRVYQVTTIDVDEGDGSRVLSIEAITADWRRGSRERL